MIGSPTAQQEGDVVKTSGATTPLWREYGAGIYRRGFSLESVFKLKLADPAAFSSETSTPTDGPARPTFRVRGLAKTDDHRYPGTNLEAESRSERAWATQLWTFIPHPTTIFEKQNRKKPHFKSHLATIRTWVSNEYSSEIRSHRNIFLAALRRRDLRGRSSRAQPLPVARLMHVFEAR